MCARIAASCGLEVARLVRVDDRGVLGRQVCAALELAAADHLHHQVHRQLAVEAREQGVAGEIDLVLVEGGVRGVPLGVRDGLGGRLVQLAEAAQAVPSDPADRRSRPRGARARAARRSPPRAPTRSAASRSSRAATSRSGGPPRRAASARGGPGCGRRRAGGQLVQAQLLAGAELPAQSRALASRRPARSGSSWVGR